MGLMGTPKWSEGGAHDVGVVKSKLHKLIQCQMHMPDVLLMFLC